MLRIMKLFERFTKKEESKEIVPSGFEFNPELDHILRELSKAYSAQSGIYLDGYPEGEDKEEYDQATKKINEFKTNQGLKNKIESYLRPYRQLYAEREGWEEEYLQGGWSPAYIPSHISHLLRVLESLKKKGE